MQAFDEIRVRGLERTVLQAPAARGFRPETLEGVGGEVGHADAGMRRAVPVAPELAQQEGGEGGAGELLLRAATADVVLAAVADGAL